MGSRTSPARHPNVGVLGYALGGGLSWMLRKHGLACNSITAAEVVTADGRLVRADRETEPELFWALRGGGGNVGAVTAIELELFPIAEIYAGALFWPIERAAEILNAWRAWIETVPDDVRVAGPACSSCRTPRSCPTTSAAARSCWSRPRSSARAARARPSSSRSATSARSSTPSR